MRSIKLYFIENQGNRHELNLKSDIKYLQSLSNQLRYQVNIWLANDIDSLISKDIRDQLLNILNLNFRHHLTCLFMTKSI